MGRLILVDTNVLIDLLEGNSRGEQTYEALESLEEEALIAYSLITRFELLAVPDVAKSASARKLLEQFSPLDLSMNVIDRAAELLVSAHRRSRRKIPDALIAATALEYGAELLTHDRHDFRNIAGLMLFVRADVPKEEKES